MLFPSSTPVTSSSSGVMKFGAKDASAKSTAKKYEMVLDEEIEFVAALKLPGSEGVGLGDEEMKRQSRKEKEREKKRGESEQEKKRREIKECQESLPVFPFKGDIIQAVHEHQVCPLY